MARALALAQQAAAAGEVPVGAVVSSATGAILGEGHNWTRLRHDPTAHAEMVALRQAGEKLGNERLLGCTLWVTLEPCAMCAAAALEARVARIVYGAADPKGGAIIHGPRLLRFSRHQPEVVGGIGEEAAATLLQAFFRERRGPG